MRRTRSSMNLTIYGAIGLLAMSVLTVRGETWIDAREATFAAQFKMTMTRTCGPPSSILKAKCDGGTIELLDTSHPSINCSVGKNEAEIVCTINCEGENDCEDVFINESTGIVYFACAAPKKTTINASIVFNDEREGACKAGLFHGSHAQKVAQLGLVCENDEGKATINFAHKLFECGRGHESHYLSNGEYGCVEDINCAAGSRCSLSFPPVTVMSTLDGDVDHECFKETTILLNNEESIQAPLVEQDTETVPLLFTTKNQASWSLHTESAASCEGTDLSFVTITCQSGGIITLTHMQNSISCSKFGEDTLRCGGDVSIGSVAVEYTCAGSSAEQALTSLQYEEADRVCDTVAHHLIQMGTLCDGKFSYDDYFWECPQGEITIDQDSRVTCFESMPCPTNVDCASTIPTVTMESSSNARECMATALLSAAPSGSPSQAPTDVPSSIPTGSPSSFPSLSPTNTPSDTPTNYPTLVPTISPTTFPSGSPSDAPTMTPSANPSNTPTTTPSVFPTNVPTVSPSEFPSDVPSMVPTNQPSVSPSTFPTSSPSVSPSRNPTTSPSMSPSTFPTLLPSAIPTSTPSSAPSSGPSDWPSMVPTSQPSSIPSIIPTASPSEAPSSVPSDLPSFVPTNQPSGSPSSSPTTSVAPTIVPSATPSRGPSASPSSSPTDLPSASNEPSGIPSSTPTNNPTQAPSNFPTVSPSQFPSGTPTTNPTLSHLPTAYPSIHPSNAPSPVPTSFPTRQPVTSVPTTVFVPSDYPSIYPPKWTESSTNLPTGHALDDDYTSPTVEPVLTEMNTGSTDQAPTTTRVDGNNTQVIEGISVDGDTPKDTRDWKLTFVYMVLLTAGMVIAIPVGRLLNRFCCRRYSHL